MSFDGCVAVAVFGFVIVAITVPIVLFGPWAR